MLLTCLDIKVIMSKNIGDLRIILW